MKIQKQRTTQIAIILLSFIIIYSCKKDRTTTSTQLPNNGIIFNPNLTYSSITDIDGNVYKTIKIGTQIWMAENLKVTHYNNGDAIPNISDSIAWSTTTNGAYCNINNDNTNTSIYGLLYNYHTVVDSRSLCPNGWVVPKIAEWDPLLSYLGGKHLAGGKLKEAGLLNHWLSPNIGATNESGFTALPAGSRWENGAFFNFKNAVSWWCSEEFDLNNALTLEVFSAYNSVKAFSNYNKNGGMSVRCIKEDTTTINRIDYIGNWDCIEIPEAKNMNFTCTITLDSNTQTNIKILNFANLNSTVFAIVNGNSLIVPKQTLVGNTIEGNGTMQNKNYITWNYYIKDNTDSITYNTTFIRNRYE
jgi:uncharacterized protein (TIGR02145 family)